MSDNLRGNFLIAGRNLRDPNFFQSVVLMVEHGDEGAMGVIVNRPSGVTVAQALKNHFELPETGEMVYVGGPVERNALFILHNCADIDGAESPVVDGLYVGSSAEAFEHIVTRASESDAKLRFRVYFGCAGWAPEQLEGELSRSDWLVLPASRQAIFQDDPYSLWGRLYRDYRQVKPLIPGVSGDPERN